MARYAYERLSAQDASFLWAENVREPMHVGAPAVLEVGPLRSGNGGIYIGRNRQAVEAVLHWIPRYRQVLLWMPIEGRPVGSEKLSSRNDPIRVSGQTEQADPEGQSTDQQLEQDRSGVQHQHTEAEAEQW